MALLLAMGLAITSVPLAVGADYGLTVLRGTPPAAAQFARFIVSPDGQAILERHGFAPGDRK